MYRIYPQICVSPPQNLESRINTAWLRRIPLRRIPHCRIPLRRIPLCRIPLRRIPFRRIPLCRIPLCRIPLRRIPLCRIPLRRKWNSAKWDSAKWDSAKWERTTTRRILHQFNSSLSTCYGRWHVIPIGAGIPADSWSRPDGRHERVASADTIKMISIAAKKDEEKKKDDDCLMIQIETG